MPSHSHDFASNHCVPYDFACKGVVGLAIHTASPQLGLALSLPTGEMKTQCWDLGRSLSTQLHSHLSAFVQPIDWADLDFIAVAKGPGGFTGTRMGVMTARTLAQQLDIPVFALSTLMVLAWADAHQMCVASSPQAHLDLQPGAVPSSLEPNGPSNLKADIQSDIQSGAEQNRDRSLDLAIDMPARRGAVYGAIYRLRLKSASSSEEGINLSLPSIVLPDEAMPEDKWQHHLKQWPQPYRRVTAGDSLGGSAVPLLSLAHRYQQRGDRPHWSEALPFYGQSPV